MTVRSVVAVLTICVAAAARADEPWSLTTRDFKTTPVTPKAIDAAGVTVAGPDGVERAVPLAEVVGLSTSQAPAKVSGLVLCVADGQRLIGRPGRIEGNTLVWAADRVGDVSVPVEAVLGILRDRTTADGLADTRAEDAAKLTSGDTVRGILTGIENDAFVLTPVAGDPVRVPVETVSQILFATPPNGRPTPAGPAFLVRVGGSTIACGRMTLAGDTLTLSVAGRDTSVKLTDVRSIDHAGGPVAWLSSRVPTESTHTPYFDGRFPAVADATVLGKPIAFRGTPFSHGIGVHGRSKLVFAVQPGDKRFRTRYAIDGNLPLADVDVRVTVDDKVVHEAKGFRAGVLSPVVEADVGGAKTITLEVDYGGGYDVQDRLNWIEPAVVRD